MGNVGNICGEAVKGEVAWENICRPKQPGGLSIKSCKQWNMASVGGHIWLLMEKQRHFVRKMDE